MAEVIKKACRVNFSISLCSAIEKECFRGEGRG